MDLLGDDFPFHAEALAGKRVLICGASGGIGAATARIMAKAGASTVVAARSVEKLDALVKELAGLGPGPHVAMALDLEDLSAVDAAVEALLSDGPVHVLVNNAGGPPGGALIDAEVDEFIAPFQRHLHASHTLVKGLPRWKRPDTAASSHHLHLGQGAHPQHWRVQHAARGHGVLGKTLSRELPPCVTINNVLPGFTATDRLSSLANSIQARTGKSAEDVHRGWMEQVFIDRLIDPLETAATLTYLALPAAGAIRGVSLAVDGGRLRSI